MTARMECVRAVGAWSGFPGWVRTHKNILGEFSPAQIDAAIDAAQKEGRQSGIDTSDRLFLYAAARLLAPYMDAIRYVKTMDVIFDHKSEIEKLRTIVNLDYS